MEIPYYPILEKGSTQEDLGTISVQKGQSVEVSSTPGKLTHRDAYILNSVYTRECIKRPLYLSIQFAEMPTFATFDPEQDIKMWYGRQLGEAISVPSYDPRTKKLAESSYKRIIDSLKKYFRFDLEVAKKYVNLHEEGYFEAEKKYSLKEYWYHRAGIDLNNYKEILAEEYERIDREEKGK